LSPLIRGLFGLKTHKNAFSVGLRPGLHWRSLYTGFETDKMDFSLSGRERAWKGKGKEEKEGREFYPDKNDK